MLGRLTILWRLQRPLQSFPDPGAAVRWALDIEREMIGHGWIKAF